MSCDHEEGNYGAVNRFSDTHRPRFPGASRIDDFLYALVNLAEAIAGVCTLGMKYPTWTMRWDNWRTRLLFLERLPSGSPVKDRT